MPHGPWKTTTFSVAVRLDGALHGDRFVAAVEPQRVPTLQAGVVGLVDNWSGPQRAAAWAASEAAGATVGFLWPYSPDCKPIEPVFANLKALLGEG